MHFGIAFLNSRVARRFFLLFLLCALLPTTLLVGYTYQRAKDQLYEQSWIRLQKECKSYSMGLLERLTQLDNLARLYASFLQDGQATAEISVILLEQIQTQFEGVGFYRPGTGMEVLHGQIDPVVGNSDSFKQLFYQSKKTSIYVSETEELRNPVYLLVPIIDGDSYSFLVVRPVDSLFWGLGANSLLPAMSELAVYDGQGNLITATQISPGMTLSIVPDRARSTNYLQFEYTNEDETYLASGWSLFLASGFNAQTWTVLLSSSTTDALGAMLEFKRLFPLLIALAFWVILFLSLVFIRKTLSPLALLQEGTQRISAQDFTSRVDISSGDEFEQLADSFNSMTGKLNKQFQTLKLIDEIDRSILSSLDSSVIIPRSLRMISEFFSCRLIILAQRTSMEQSHLRLTILQGNHRNDLTHEHIELSEEEEQRLASGASFTMLQSKHFLPGFLKDRISADTFLFLPLAGERRIRSALIMDFSAQSEKDAQEEIAQARQLADQLAIALSNARLVADLERLSIGTVEALARTVDAKSKWTAGHSERVADLAVRIGRVMQCSDQLLEQLFRGGLLHDIGKIGIPLAVLDKPGKLDEEEYDMVQTHPAIGGKILEPIEVYKDVLPLIVQHHERFDGKGYPEGLAGEKINIGARIMCVADVYDALISQRPYRQGWIKENVLNFMRENRGVMFDPDVIDAFFSIEA